MRCVESWILICKYTDMPRYVGETLVLQRDAECNEDVQRNLYDESSGILARFMKQQGVMPFVGKESRFFQMLAVTTELHEYVTNVPEQTFQ